MLYTKHQPDINISRPTICCMLSVAVCLALSFPVLAQESLLPEGFDVDNTKPPPVPPSPTQSPFPSVSPSPSPSGRSSPQLRATPLPPSTADVGIGGDLEQSSQSDQRLSDTIPLFDETIEDSIVATEFERIQRVRLRYDLPAHARRNMGRIGLLRVEDGGMPPDAFGQESAGDRASDTMATRGTYASLVMQQIEPPLLSRWGHILLRRALMSALDTPTDMRAADWVADRAALLARMGEAQAARYLIQSVDHDRASPKMRAAAMQIFLANADPAGLCLFSEAELRESKSVIASKTLFAESPNQQELHGRLEPLAPSLDPSLKSSPPEPLGQKAPQYWLLVAGICSALALEPSLASSAIERARNSRQFDDLDIALAERIMGASLAGRSPVTIEWKDDNPLSDWHFGMATAAAIEIPLALRSRSPTYMPGWTVLAPMSLLSERLRAGAQATARGVLSGATYRGLVIAAADEIPEDSMLAQQADNLQTAFVGRFASSRIEAMTSLWDTAETAVVAQNRVQESLAQARARYGAMVMTARAAAAIPPNAEVMTAPDYELIGAMLAGGFDHNAAAWSAHVAPGSRAWSLLAVATPQPQTPITAEAIGQFIENDDSPTMQHSQLLLAALVGLGRIDEARIAVFPPPLQAAVRKESRWSRALGRAAENDEVGLVALLVAAGMQGEDWAGFPPYHLLHMTQALRRVGLESEARMIAAETLFRLCCVARDP